jgi:hypothetical protein
MVPEVPLRLRPRRSCRQAILLAVPLVLALTGAPAAHATSAGSGIRSASPVSAEGMTDPGAMLMELALNRFTPVVTRSSHPDALRLAFQAYYNYRAANSGLVRKPYLYFVDLGLDNRTPRGYVFDMDALELVDGPFAVAHGVGSSSERNAVPTYFSNRPGSNASSLGLYLAEETYGFNGRAAGGRYTSVGLRLRGESGEFNGAARRRGIVAHGAPYVNGSEAGRSEGCPAMEQQRARRLLPMLADGGVVFIYSPNHPRWLQSDPWINGHP